MINAQSLGKQAKEKIKTLEKLIKVAEKKRINVLKEKTTIRTAEIFLTYADWDEKHIDKNVSFFEKAPIYKKEALKMAKHLPEFERKDVFIMLEEAIKHLQLVIDEKVFRQYAPMVDWGDVSLVDDQLMFEGKPVFLAGYVWKPNTKKLTEYHGNLDGFFMTPSYVEENGNLIPKIHNKLINKEDKSVGFVFMNHKSVPKWALDEYGDSLVLPTDRYTVYDIDNPGAKAFQKKLIKATVPYTANKKFSELGYMLCNEPHFYTQKTGDKLAWASGPVTEYTKAKFRDWLKEKHQDIEKLNKLWSTDFSDFKSVKIEIPIDTKNMGTPMWYDWSVFNMDRVTAWYQFLKSEILKHDEEAKVHLKIMPNLWTENQRVHGIDLEALTELSGIVGNDSGATHSRMWGAPKEWEEHYAFEWRELCMGFDFMKSVSPKKINFNSELHYLSTGSSRNLYLDPQYARATFWLAHIYGMTASQIWFWPRQEDGSIRYTGKGYAASNSQQPRVTNEVATTMIDLNANADVIMAMQRQRKPIRIYYSKASAINKKEHMDNIYHLYESMHFEGVPLGFATKSILQKQDHDNWDVLIIYKTPFVTQEEFGEIQKYIDRGGMVIIDSESLKYNEYGIPFAKTLKSEKKNLIIIDSHNDIKDKALSLIEEKGLTSGIVVEEKSAMDKKGCVWRVVKNKDGNDVLSVVNIGKSNAEISVLSKRKKRFICKDIINGIEVSTNPKLKPLEVFFVEIVYK
ncbi:beta-galactosidase [Flavivirga algicola]|uniref:Glycoside hydrolase family 42 N-terminal domain-containing protein n=1 Tax=Flavivirga algicola TaxID=2729136 RepID=A0ABX1RXF2_9FLAO|nr:beta-galactosidase [Flavivirga algicola]NMH86884.1 hypothetical protein [Flavivirga algicola]